MDSTSVFVDTGIWFARFVPSDPHHLAARQLLGRTDIDYVTTDYIVDESLTLLRVRRESHRALEAGLQFFGGGLADIYHVTPEDVLAAWAVFRDYSDKAWSFTDCTSMVVMRRLGITKAFAFDDHFRQFGTVTVEP